MKTPQIIDRLQHALKYCSPSQRELSTGSVYFIQCNEFVKIGYANNVLPPDVLALLLKSFA